MRPGTEDHKWAMCQESKKKHAPYKLQTPTHRHSKQYQETTSAKSQKENNNKKTRENPTTTTTAITYYNVSQRKIHNKSNDYYYKYKSQEVTEREREKESVCDMKGELYYYGQPSVFECVFPV